MDTSQQVHLQEPQPILKPPSGSPQKKRHSDGMYFQVAAAFQAFNSIYIICHKKVSLHSLDAKRVKAEPSGDNPSSIAQRRIPRKELVDAEVTQTFQVNRWQSRGSCLVCVKN